MSALRYLLDRPPRARLHPVVMALCVLMGLVAIEVLAASPNRLREVPGCLLAFEWLAVVIVPLTWSSHNGLLGRLRQQRFLESGLLTGLSASEWSDGLLWYGIQPTLRPLLMLSPLLAAVMAWSSPRWDVLNNVLQTAEWVPTLVCLMAATAYMLQIRGLLDLGRPGRELPQAVLLGAFVVGGYWLIDVWTEMGPLACLEGLVIAFAVLAGLRQFILARMNALLMGDKASERSQARAMRPWGGNLIVMRECWRSARRGGRLMVYARRLGLLTVFTALMARAVYDVGVGLGPWFIYFNDCAWTIIGLLVVYAVMAVPLVYWQTMSAVFDERRQMTAPLLEATAVTGRAYRNGWVDWATRYRNLELLALYSVALMGVGGCLWAETGWDLARWAPTLLHQQMTTLWTVMALGVSTWVWMQIAAHVALNSSARTTSGLALQLGLLPWMVSYLVVAGTVCGFIYLSLGLLPTWTINIGFCLAFYQLAAARSKQSLETDSGALVLTVAG